MGDVGFSRRYRTKEELDARWRQEPVGRFRTWLLENQVLSEEEVAEVEAQVEAEMQEAADFVSQSPMPDLSELTEHVYA
jgi:pyruvate dehydrogenase E1 component alpha subunit